jgi:hypothetical protein
LLVYRMQLMFVCWLCILLLCWFCRLVLRVVRECVCVCMSVCMCVCVCVHVCVTRDWTQGLAFARQALCYLSHTHSPFAFSLFFPENLVLCTVWSWTMIILFLLPEWLGLKVYANTLGSPSFTVCVCIIFGVFYIRSYNLWIEAIYFFSNLDVWSEFLLNKD